MQHLTRKITICLLVTQQKVPFYFLVARYFIICGGVSAFGFLDFKRLSFTDNRFVFPFFPCICRKVGIVPTKIVFLLAYSDISSIFV